jgi:hypothetical protein
MSRWTGYTKLTPDERNARRRASREANRAHVNTLERDRRAANPDQERHKRREWRKNHRAAAMILDARKRAKRLNVPFDLTASDIEIPSVCSVDGLPLGTGRRSRSPSLDRIRPALGYVRGNIDVISTLWNSRKRDMEINDVRLLLGYMEYGAGAMPEAALSFGA